MHMNYDTAVTAAVQLDLRFQEDLNGPGRGAPAGTSFEGAGRSQVILEALR
jgi:hypothetical protein